MNNQLIIPIITTLLTVIFSGAAINILISSYFQPHIDLSILSTPYKDKPISIRINNTGNAPVTHMRFTAEMPSKITNYKILSTENYTKINSSLTNILEFYFPRFTNGEGSYIEITPIMNAGSINNISRYIVFITHDKGSIKFVENSSKNIESSKSNFSEFFFAILSSIISGIATFISIIMRRKSKTTIAKEIVENTNSKISIKEFLEKIMELKNQGVLSEDEFLRIKNALSINNKEKSVDTFLDELKKLKNNKT